jgi:hypothetical protein
MGLFFGKWLRHSHFLFLLSWFKNHRSQVPAGLRGLAELSPAKKWYCDALPQQGGIDPDSPVAKDASMEYFT